MSRANIVAFAGTCPTTGKRGWQTRGDAKRQIRRVHPGEHMAAYACTGCGWWHIGHLPGQIRKGIAGRDALRSRGDA